MQAEAEPGAGEGQEDDVNMASSPPRRRRSTFFVRRDSVVPQLQNEDPINQQIDKAVEEYKRRQYLDELSRYFDKLTAEKESWRCEHRERRSKFYDTRRPLQVATSGTFTTPIDYSVLTNEDIEFLQKKPNVVKIAESARDLKEAVTKTMQIMQKLTEVDLMLIDRCEHKVNTIQRYILDNSTIEPVE